MKKVMILSANYTGYGHKSIADSLIEQFSKHDDIEVTVIDGFNLVGRAGIRASKMYGPMTRWAKDLWGLTYLSTTQSPTLISELMELLIHDKFMKKLIVSPPDIIISVHALFVGAALNILTQYKIDIPFVTLLADIIDIHPYWCDERSTAILCPTPESAEAAIKNGIPRTKLIPCGFPTRERFTSAAREFERKPYDPSKPLEFLLMSGGEGSGNLKKYAMELLSSLDCNVRIITGRNAKMKQLLEETLKPEFGSRAKIYGFCENVQEHMLESDIVIARGSPNTLMEAVVCNAPLIITGALPGQEARNPMLMQNHKLGAVCKHSKRVVGIVQELIANNGEKLNEMQIAQREYRDFDNAKNIVDYILSITTVKKRTIPHFKLRMPVVGQAKLAIRVAKRPFKKLKLKKKSGTLK